MSINYKNMYMKNSNVENVNISGNSAKLPVIRCVVEKGMRVVVACTGVEATVEQVFPNRYVMYKYNAPLKDGTNYGATTVRGLKSVDGAELVHPSSV